VSAGILSGYADGTLRPNSGLTRAELAVIIARSMKLEDQKDKAANFTDHSKLPEWAKGAIGAVAAKGIMQGKEGGKFDFNAVATRAEVITILLRILELDEN
ncbi:S-layer homology domain-containing protein, partial [Paenibacillus sp. TAF43_2]|uniref:S-layer homology domain-containing protein n=1 Tax=Paenibacillus sp. TAF43_2 TaxID=3233069 RepID=UPI003F9D4C0A